MEQNEFVLKKLKMYPSGQGLIVEWEHCEGTPLGELRISSKQASSKIQHPDLTKAVQGLIDLAQEVFVFKDKDGNKERMAVSGFALSGEDDEEAITITVRVETKSGYDVSANTHRIKFSDEIYGVEKEAYERLDKIKREVYAYLFLDKKAQFEIMFDEKGKQDKQIQGE